MEPAQSAGVPFNIPLAVGQAAMTAVRNELPVGSHKIAGPRSAGLWIKQYRCGTEKNYDGEDEEDLFHSCTDDPVNLWIYDHS